MAFVAEQKKEQLGEQGQPSGSGQSAFIGGSGQAPAGGQAPASTGSGYTNLNKYLEVNDGAGIGQAVQSKVSADTDAFKTSGEGFKNQVNSQVDSGIKTDTNNLANQLKTDPTKVNKQDYSNLTSGYGGPSKLANITGYQGFENGYQAAYKGTQDLKNVGTQGEIIKDSAKKDLTSGLSYNKGMRNLDSLFLQDQQPGIQKSIDTSTKTLTDYRTGVDTQFDSRKAAAETASNQTRDTLNSARTSQRDAIMQGAQDQLAGKNAGLNRSNLGVSEASLGDALDPNSLASLEALSNLGGEAYDPTWYAKSYNEGVAPVAVNVDALPQPVANPVNVEGRPAAKDRDKLQNNQY